MRTCAWRLREIDGLNPEQEALLATIADPLHNNLFTEFFNMVFYWY
jgi:hypothetical protein